MKIRTTRVAVLCGAGLLGASMVPLPVPVDDRGGILSAVVEPLRFIHRDAAAQGSNTTPSHVFQLGSDLLSEIEIVREAMGVTDYPLEAEPAEDRAPIHVYSKTLEVRTKIAAAQKRLGMTPSSVGRIPVKQVLPKDVYGSVESALAEVRRVKEQLVIEDEIEPAELEGGRTPSHVYQLMGDASYMMDGLVGRPQDVNDVFRNLTLLLGDMELVATKLKVALALEPPEAKKRKRLKEVGQQVMRGTFKLINLQTRLGMDASGVPEVTLVRVTPANLYEAINIMNAEMVRIKVHLDILLPPEETDVARNKKPRDLFAMAVLIVRNLDRLAKAADAYVAAQS